MPEVILQAQNLVKHYPIKRGVLRRTVGQVKAVDGVSFDLHKGETLGIVGESGCGKSTLGRLLMRLEDPTSGKVLFGGEDWSSASGREMRRLRRDIQIVFQDPYTSLNPRMTVGDIVGEPFEIHADVVPKGGRRKRVQELLDLVGLNPEHINRYPHQFSGGQRQRIGIAPRHRAQPEGARLRRAGLGARRVGAGAGRQPHGEAPGRARPRLPLHRPRPVGRAPHLRPGRGHVPRPDGRDRRGGRGLHRARRTPTPRRCCRRCRCPTRPCAASGSRSSSRATCPRRRTRRPDAGSTPAAGRRRRSAASRSPSSILRAGRPRRAPLGVPLRRGPGHRRDGRRVGRRAGRPLHGDRTCASATGSGRQAAARTSGSSAADTVTERSARCRRRPARRRTRRGSSTSSRTTAGRRTPDAPHPAHDAGGPRTPPGGRGVVDPADRCRLSRPCRACGPAAGGAGSPVAPGRPDPRRRWRPTRRGRTPPRRACTRGDTARCRARGRRSAGRSARGRRGPARRSARPGCR